MAPGILAMIIATFFWGEMPKMLPDPPKTLPKAPQGPPKMLPKASQDPSKMP